MRTPETNYEKLKLFLDWSDDIVLIRKIAIELMDNGEWEPSFYNYKKEIESFFNNN